MQAIYDTFLWLGEEGALLLISMIPLIELRGAVIVGTAMDMPWQEVYLISVIGNMLPIPFIILFGRHLFALLRKTPFLAPLFAKYEAKLMKKSDKVLRYSFWGLVLFVAVPLPGTGAWSGAAISVLLNMRLKYSLPAIFLGVLIAGMLMTLGSQGVFGALRLF
ncbi:MAG: COG2426 family protein [Eubacteriales bacterium]|jgi:uncharacterized membrane protein